MPTQYDAIFKAYDVRGVVPDQLDTEGARRIGAAFASFVKAPQIIVARDMRPSGVDLRNAFSEGIMSIGTDVIDIGLISTDMLYFAAGFLNAPGATFTASHNPAQYNGIKFCLAGAVPISEETGLKEIRNLSLQGVPVAEQQGRRAERDLLPDFVKHVLSFIDVSVLTSLRVVADTANGMGGLVAPDIFSKLPFDFEIMYPELDGTFPNHPADPIQPENLRDLQRRVLDTKSDVGLAFDGDADRVFLVDETGSLVPGSTITAIVADAMLSRNPGATILYNVICSRAVAELIERRGGVGVRTRVGHSFIKAVMAETNAIFGGEHSGHYYFRDNYRADSGIIAAVIVLELLSRAGQPLSQFRKPYEPYALSGEINTEVANPFRVIEAIANEYQEYPQDRLDGLTVDCGDWWFNVRPSNTEPLLRLNVEAPDAEACQKRVSEVRDVIEKNKSAK
jgi:phosphomannomutase